jgi:alkane 1-monooxygenase
LEGRGKRKIIALHQRPEERIMKGYTAALASGEAIHYVDRKRWFWTLSVLYPLQPFLGIWLHATTGNEAWLLLPLFTGYVVAPIVDMLFFTGS